MEWADVVLSTPSSIARFEKEINTITDAAVEKILFDDSVGSSVNTAKANIKSLKGFGLVHFETSNDFEGTVTAKLKDSDDDTTFVDTLIQLKVSETIPEREFVLPPDIEDHILFALTGGTAGSLTITIKSAWASKHEVAKDIIANIVKTYIKTDLDDLENADELSIAANYLVLHLIYADLELGYGENEVYSAKKKFYYKQYETQIKPAIRRLTVDAVNIKADTVLLR